MNEPPFGGFFLWGAAKQQRHYERDGLDNSLAGSSHSTAGGLPTTNQPRPPRKRYAHSSASGLAWARAATASASTRAARRLSIIATRLLLSNLENWRQ
jgi:hypothetical protein